MLPFALQKSILKFHPSTSAGDLKIGPLRWSRTVSKLHVLPCSPPDAVSRAARRDEEYYQPYSSLTLSRHEATCNNGGGFKASRNETLCFNFVQPSTPSIFPIIFLHEAYSSWYCPTAASSHRAWIDVRCRENCTSHIITPATITPRFKEPAVTLMNVTHVSNAGDSSVVLFYFASGAFPQPVVQKTDAISEVTVRGQHIRVTSGRFILPLRYPILHDNKYSPYNLQSTRDPLYVC